MRCVIRHKKIEINKNIDFAFINSVAKQFDVANIGIELLFRKNFAKPSGIAYLSSLVESKRNFIKKIIYEENAISYLQRANFFKNFNVNIKEKFKRYEVSKNMLECTKISKDGDPDFIDQRLKQILKAHLGTKEYLLLGILLTTYEIVDNILEHSTGGNFSQTSRNIKKSGFVCAQYYNTSTIEIGISDSGIGIINSMKEAYPELSRQEVLCKAFELNTTRYIKTMPSRGNGLAKLKEFVLESNGEIICRTNEYQITFNNQHKNGIIKDEKDDLEGTHFQIIIGCQRDIDTKKIFDAIPSDYEDDSFDDFFDF